MYLQRRLERALYEHLVSVGLEEPTQFFVRLDYHLTAPHKGEDRENQETKAQSSTKAHGPRSLHQGQISVRKENTQRRDQIHHVVTQDEHEGHGHRVHEVSKGSLVSRKLVEVSDYDERLSSLVNHQEDHKLGNSRRVKNKQPGNERQRHNVVEDDSPVEHVLGVPLHSPDPQQAHTEPVEGIKDKVSIDPAAEDLS